jgi:hypothetical protein
MMEIRWNVLLGKLNMSNMSREFLLVFAVFAQALDSELTKRYSSNGQNFLAKKNNVGASKVLNQQAISRVMTRRVRDIIPIDHDPHGETPRVETNSMQLLVMNHLR